MPSIQLQPRFKSTQHIDAWLAAFARENPDKVNLALWEARKECYLKIEAKRGRPLLVYVSKLWDVPPGISNNIDLADVELFVDLVNSIPIEAKEVDILIHSPGGRPDVAERIVAILRNRFARVNFLVPHSAYSAATMLVLSGNEIVMHPSAALGPIDPQIDGIPARSIQRGFEKIKQELEKDARLLPAYIPLLEKYSLHLLEICGDAQELSKKLVTDWLEMYMFAGQDDAKNKASQVANFFSNYDEQLLHARPLTYGKIKHLGLVLELTQDDMSDLLWEAYLLISVFFRMSSCIKLFENTHGMSYGRFVQQPAAPQGK